MNDLQRSVKIPNPSTKSLLPSAQTGRKVTIYFLAVLIVLVMIVWFSFLGWGFIAMLQWLLDCIKNLSRYF
jgi:type VI protein secretion system component VasF